MYSVLVLGSALAFAAPAFAASAQVFQPPAVSPESQSGNYTGPSNGTITNSPLVPGKAFDRYIQVWMENTDFNTAAQSPVFQSIAEQGILLTAYYALTHPSAPEYIGTVGGEYWGDAADDYRHIPSNISTVVDLLDAKNISWASYQENSPYRGYTGYNYTSYDYITGTEDYTYYVRKHSPLIMYDSVANVTERALRIRNFNDFAVDLDANVLPQWSFITPNLVNDGHDTDVTFMSNWLTYWLIPLLKNPNFNNNRTLILFTFDETETYTINNQVYTVAVGGGVPEDLRNTTDDTFYCHYMSLSTVQANWGLGSLGRQDTNATMNNVLSWVANITGWKNNNLTGADPDSLPLLNLTGTIAGPLNPELYVPFTAPNMSGIGAGGGPVFVSPGMDTSFTLAEAPAPVNLTALGETLPWAADAGYDYPNGVKTFTNTSGPATSGAGRSGVPAVVVLVAVVAAAGVLL